MKQDINILIAKFLDGNITSEEKQILLGWCNLNEENRTHFQRIKNIWYATHPVFDPNTIDTSNAERTVLQKIKNQQKPSYKTILLAWQKIAAILLLPLLLLSIYLFINNNKLQHPQVTTQEISALPGTRTKVNLPDGSEAWLNSGSTLSYSLPFTTSQRKITLVGEGFFSVKADKKHPFIVSAKELEVVVTGTKLNVEAYPGDSLHIVTLMEGKASVTADNQEPVNLKPNQQFSLNTHTQLYNMYTTDAALYGQWKDGILAFRDETLENVFKRIARTFNVEIHVKDPRLATHSYHATFEKESLQQIMNAIQLSAPIQYNVSEVNGKEVFEVYYK